MKTTLLKIKQIFTLAIVLVLPFVLSAQNTGISGDSTINRCQTKTYTISLQNNSGNDLTGLIIIAKLQNLTGFSYVSGTANLDIDGGGAFCTNDPVLNGGYSGNCTPAPSSDYLTWNIDSSCGTLTLADGETLNITFDLETGCDAVSGSLNTYIDYILPGPTPMCDDTGVLNIQVNPGAVTIKKTDPVIPQLLGENVTWTITVENTGFGVIENVEITDVLGAGLLYINSTQSGINSGQTTTWTSAEYAALASMDPGDILTMEIEAKVISCTNLDNVADVRFGCNPSPSDTCFNTTDDGGTANAAVQRIARTPNITFTPPDISFTYCEDTQNISFTISNIGDGIAYDVFTIVDFTGFTISNVSSGAIFNTTENRFELADPLAASGDAGDSYNLSFDITYSDWCNTFPARDLLWQKLYKDECNQDFYPPVELSSINTPSSSTGVSVGISGGNAIIQIGTATINHNITSSYSGPLSCASGSSGLVTVVMTVNPGFRVTDPDNGVWVPGSDGTGGTITWTYTPPTSLSEDIVLEGPREADCETYCYQPYSHDLTASGTDCCGCSVTGSASHTGVIECEELVDSEKSVSPVSQELCNTVTYTNTYIFSGGISTNLNDLIFTEHAENEQEYQDASLTVNLTGPGDITGCAVVTNTTAGAGGNLALDFTTCAATPLSGQTLTITYQMELTDDTLSQCANSSFYSWSTLNIGGSGTECLPDGEIHEATVVSTNVPSMSVSISGLGRIFDTCESKTITITLTQTSSSADPKDVKLVLEGLNYYVIDAGNPAAITCTGDVSPVACLPVVDVNGDYVWTFNDVFTGQNQYATIELDVQKRCTGIGELKATAFWDDNCTNNTTPEETCSAVGSETPVLLRTGDLLIEKTPETYYADTNLVQWEIYVTNRGTGTAYNVWIDDVLGAGLVYEHGVNPLTVDAGGSGTISTYNNLDHNGSAINGASARISFMEAGERRQITMYARQIDCTNLTNDVTTSWGCISGDCKTSVTDNSIVTLPAPNLINTNTVTPAGGIQSCSRPDGFITLRNAGQVTCYNLTVNVTLPTGLTYTPGFTRWRLNGGTWNPVSLPDNTYDPDTADPITWTKNKIPALSEIASGDTIEIEYKMDASCPFEGGSLTVATQYENPCATVFNTSDSTFTLAFNRPDIEITKTRINQPIDCGQEIEWNISVTNNSGYTLPIIWVEDTLDAAYKADMSRTTGDGTYSADNGTNPGGGQVVQWELVDVPTGTTVNLTLGADTDNSPCSPDLDNTVDAWWGCDDPNNKPTTPDEDSSTKPSDEGLCLGGTGIQIVKTETRQPSMSYVSVAMSPSSINSCDTESTLTVVVQNVGATDARNFDLEITLPPGLVYNSGSSQSGLGTSQANAESVLAGIGDPVITGGGTILTWNNRDDDATGKADDLINILQADGGNDTLALRFSVQSSCFVTADLSFDIYYYDCCEDSQYSTNTTQTLTALYPDLAITKTPVNSQVACNADQTWLITVTNNGTGQAEVIRVEDTPGDWIDVRTGQAGDPVDMGGGVYGWEVNNLAAGADVQFTIVGTLNPDKDTCQDSDRQNNVQVFWACGVSGDAIDGDPTTTDDYSCTDSSPAEAAAAILQMPNLIITSITPAINCTEDGTFTGTVTVRVTNDGDAATDGSLFTVQVTDGKGWTSEGTHTGIIAGNDGYADVVINTPAWAPDCQPCGTPYSFDVTIDTGDTICECNENDNSLSNNTYPVPLPDLKVTADTLGISCSSDGNVSISGSITVTNDGCAGSVSAAIPVKFTLYDNIGCTGTVLGTFTQSFTPTNPISAVGGNEVFTISNASIEANLCEISGNCAVSIGVEVDPDDNICECDGTNNIYCADGKSYNIPEIEVNSENMAITCSSGDTIRVSGNITMINNGCGNNFNDNIPLEFTLYASAGCSGPVLGTWTQSFSSVLLNSGGGNTQTFTVNSPNISANLSGDCTVSILVEVDPDNTAICECSGNNSFCTDEQINIPDLTVSDNTMEVVCSSAGHVTLSGNVSIANEGCGDPFQDPIPVRFILYDNLNCSGNVLGTWTRNYNTGVDIASGDSQDFSFSETFAADIPAVSNACQVSLLIELDYDTSTICESDGTNNSQYTNITAKVPDLTINSVGTSITCLGDGNLTGTTVSVSNTGCGIAEGVVVRLTSDCGLTFADQIINLAGGETRDVFFTFTSGITNCSCNFTAEIDPDNLICENNEGNNSSSSALGMSIPDLEPGITEIEAQCLKDGWMTLTGSLSILNRGCGGAFSQPVPVKFSLFAGSDGNGTPLIQWTERLSGGSINPGSRRIFNLTPFDFETGSLILDSNCEYSVLIELDHDNSICEWDGTNNSILTNIQSDCLDLSLNDIEYTCNPDNSISLTIPVTNTGNRDIKGVELEIMDDNNVISRQSIDIPKNDTVTITVTTPIYPKEINSRITVNLDKSNLFCESLSNNNTDTIDIHCIPPGTPKLELTKTCPNGNKPGGIFNFEIEIKNTGSGDLTDVVIEDTLPDFFTYINDSSILAGKRTDDPTGTKILKWTIPEILKGQKTTIRFSAVADSDIDEGRYCNYVSASGIALDNSKIKSPQVQCCTVVTRGLTGCCIRIEQTLKGSVRIPDIPIAFIEPYFPTEKAMFTVYSFLHFYQKKNYDKHSQPEFVKERLKNYALATLEELYLKSGLGIPLENGSIGLSFAGAYPKKSDKDQTWNERDVNKTMTPSQIAFELLALGEGIKIEQNPEKLKKYQNIIQKKLEFLSVNADNIPHQWKYEEKEFKGQEEEASFFDLSTLLYSLANFEENEHPKIQKIKTSILQKLSDFEDSEPDQSNLDAYLYHILALDLLGNNETALQKMEKVENNYKNNSLKIMNLSSHALAIFANSKVSGTIAQDLKNQMLAKYYHEDANIFAEPQVNFTHKLKLNALASLSLAFETPVLNNPDFFASCFYRMVEETGLFLNQRNIKVPLPPVNLIKNYPFQQKMTPFLSFIKGQEKLVSVFSKEAVIHTSKISPLGDNLFPFNYAKIVSPNYSLNTSRAFYMSYSMQKFAEKLQTKSNYIQKEKGRALYETSIAYLDSLINSESGYKIDDCLVLPFDHLALKGNKDGQKIFEPLINQNHFDTETLANLIIAEQAYLKNPGKNQAQVERALKYQKEIVRKFETVGFIPKTFILNPQKNLSGIQLHPSEKPADKLTHAKLYSVFNSQFGLKKLKKAKGELTPQDLVYLYHNPQLITFFNRELHQLIKEKKNNGRHSAARVLNARLKNKNYDDLLKDLDKYWEKDVALPGSGDTKRQRNTLISKYQPLDFILYLLAIDNDQDTKYKRTLNYFTYLLESEWGIIKKGQNTVLPPSEFWMIKDKPKIIPEPGDLLTFNVILENRCPDFSRAIDLSSVFIEANFFPPLIYSGTQFFDNLNVLRNFLWHYQSLNDGHILDYDYQTLIPSEFKDNYIEGNLHVRGYTGYNGMDPDGVFGDFCQEWHKIAKLPIQPLTEVKILAFQDQNANGIKEEGEKYLGNILFKDSLGRIFRTNSEGEAFINTGLQTLIVQVDLQSVDNELYLTTPASRLINRNFTEVLAFGFTPCLEIEGLIFVDDNQNSLYDSGEQKLSGVVIQAHQKKTISSFDGKFYFRNLPELWEEGITISPNQIFNKKLPANAKILLKRTGSE